MALHGPARALAERLGVTCIHLSITHDAGVAAAVAILEGEGGRPSSSDKLNEDVSGRSRAADESKEEEERT
jgi:holo-[acyl-carrier protein] synthase